MAGIDGGIELIGQGQAPGLSTIKLEKPSVKFVAQAFSEPQRASDPFSHFHDLQKAAEEDPMVMVTAAEEVHWKLLRAKYTKEDVQPTITPEDIAIVSAGWDIADKKYMGLYHSGEGLTQEGDYWDEMSFKLHEGLEAYVWGRVPRESFEFAEPLSADQINILQRGGYGEIQNLLTSESFPARSQLINYLKYDMWLNYRHVILSGDSSLAQQHDHAFHHQALHEFEKKKALTIPLLQEAANSAALSDDHAQIYSIFEGLKNVQAEGEAADFLLGDALSQEQRLRLTVEHINAFGFIRTVDILAANIADPSVNPTLRLQLKSVYNMIEGDAVDEVMVRLSDVYGRIDFDGYTRNSSELTKVEADLLDRAATRVWQKKGSEGDKKDVRILDLAAGTGRHMQELIRRGYTKVMGVDFEAKHVQKIKRRMPEAMVIQADWGNLPFSRELLTKEPIDVVYCIGGSAPHNRKPQEMFHFFDEQQRVLAYEGVDMVDFPDVNWEYYAQSIAKLQNSLEGLGVKPTQAQVLFDGPNSELRFNRQIYTEEQMKAMGTLLGFKITARESVVVSANEHIGRVMYQLEKDEQFDPLGISRQTMNDCCHTLGLLQADTDYNQMVEAWNMTLGQALLYGMDDDHISDLNSRGRGPKVFAEFDGTTIFLEASTTKSR